MLVSGIEPNLRWRTFASGVLEAAERLEVEMVVTLGALLADVPHTRPVPITGLASDPELVERLGLSRSSYEGPTGIVGIIHDACRQRGVTSASLWAAVPHYVAAVPNPKAALALLRRLEGFTGVAIEASELEDAMARFETQVDRAVASNPEIEELVRRLEVEQDDEPPFSEGEVPTGDTIARDFQRFLRQRGEADPASSSALATPSRGGSSRDGLREWPKTMDYSAKCTSRRWTLIPSVRATRARESRHIRPRRHTLHPYLAKQRPEPSPEPCLGRLGAYASWRGRSGGSRTRSRSRATGAARSPARSIPAATSSTVRSTRSASSGSARSGTRSSASTYQ